MVMGPESQGLQWPTRSTEHPRSLTPHICSRSNLSGRDSPSGALAPSCFHLNPQLQMYCHRPSQEAPMLKAETVCTAALLITTAKKGGQPRSPSPKEWIKKTSYIHTMQFYSEVKNEILRKTAEIIMYGVGGMELTCCESQRSHVKAMAVQA